MKRKSLAKSNGRAGFDTRIGCEHCGNQQEVPCPRCKEQVLLFTDIGEYDLAECPDCGFKTRFYRSLDDLVEYLR